MKSQGTTTEMIIEPVSETQLNALLRSMSPMARMISRMNDVDLSLGRGVLGKLEHCLWTKDKHRITVTILETGGLLASVSKDVDPACPQSSLSNTG